MNKTPCTKAVVDALAQAREAFLTLAQWLESQSRVIRVTSGMDARAYRDGAVCEFFVEAELETGNAVCWWMDIRESEGQWIVDPSTFVQHSGGQDQLTVQSLTNLQADADFRDQLNRAVTELIRSPSDVLEAALQW